MDVRCDRCQTEYELDDESIAEGGASVQCTSCGHTFVVGRQDRPGGKAPVAAATTPGALPTTSSWMLTTEEGKTHRFRDSTTLQKWVVERRVGRADRVCPPGGTWRRLGDLDELRPFFDVVDQADRAAAAARTARPTRPETPRGSSQSRSAYVSHDADDDDILTSSGGNNSGRRPRPSSVSAGFESFSVDDDLAAAGLSSRHGGRKLAVGALAVLAVVAAYLGFKGPRGFRFPGGAANTPDATPVASPAPPVVPVPPPSVPAAPVAAAPVAAAPAPAAPRPEAPEPAAPAAAPPASPLGAKGAPPQAPAEPAAAAAHGAAAPAEPGRPKNYEHLVADADHALENGQTAKAQKLYDEALRLQPNGVAAVTGAAYLLLDRQKPLAAIDMFKRALGNAPSFSQALFGLGEAYRLEGEPAKAIEAYRRYLEASPSGSDAPAARRQMRELQSQAAATTPRQETAPASPVSPISPSAAPTSPPPQL
jgi:predicted Zn finger-like uncharacterized protein